MSPPRYIGHNYWRQTAEFARQIDNCQISSNIWVAQQQIKVFDVFHFRSMALFNIVSTQTFSSKHKAKREKNYCTRLQIFCIFFFIYI